MTLKIKKRKDFSTNIFTVASPVTECTLAVKRQAGSMSAIHQQPQPTPEINRAPLEPAPGQGEAVGSREQGKLRQGWQEQEAAISLLSPWASTHPWGSVVGPDGSAGPQHHGEQPQPGPGSLPVIPPGGPSWGSLPGVPFLGSLPRIPFLGVPPEGGLPGSPFLVFPPWGSLTGIPFLGFLHWGFLPWGSFLGRPSIEVPSGGSFPRVPLGGPSLGFLHR